MALFTRWFTKFSRTRPSCSRASFTISTKRAAAGEQVAASARHRVKAGSCARMSSATLRHLNHTRLSGATKVKRPKGSPLLPYGDSSGVAVGSTEASWILPCEARLACFAITSLTVKKRAGAGAGVLEMSGAIDGRREGVVIGAATGTAAGGVGLVSAATTIGCGAAALPAATFSTTGILLAAVALVSTAAAATKPKNSTTGSHWAAIRARDFALMLNTPRPGRCN